MPPPIGLEVDLTPRPLPASVSIRGQYASLEPLHRRHAAKPWRSAQGADKSWTYLGTGPFVSPEAMACQVRDLAAKHDPMPGTVRPVTTDVVTGWLAPMGNASIELWNICFSPTMQCTRAGTEAVFILPRRRLNSGSPCMVWKCDAMNAPSRRAAERLDFNYVKDVRDAYDG